MSGARMAAHGPADARRLPAAAWLTARAGLLSAGLVIAAVYLVPLTIPLFPAWLRTAAPQPSAPASVVAMGWAGLVLALGYALVLVTPFSAYARALREAEREVWVAPASFLAVVGLVASAALAMFPCCAHDVFVYIVYSRLWVVHGENPLTATPSLHPEDWATPLWCCPEMMSAYGPLWRYVSWPITVASGDALVLHVLGYKLLMLAAYVGCCALIWRVAPAGARRRSLLLFAWSPVVLFDGLAKAHNDLLLALFALVAVALTARSGGAPGLLAAVAGALVKAPAAAVGPPLLAHLWRRRQWRSLVLGIAGGLLLGALSYAPFWEGSRTLTALWSQANTPGWSLSTLLGVGAELLLGDRPALVIRGLLAVVWLALVGAIMLRHPTRSVQELASAGALSMLATFVLLTNAYFAHYLIPVIALSAASNGRRLQEAVLLISLGAMLGYAVEWLGLFYGPDWRDSVGWETAGSVAVLAPVAVTVWQLARHRIATVRLAPPRPA